MFKFKDKNIQITFLLLWHHLQWRILKYLLESWRGFQGWLIYCSVKQEQKQQKHEFKLLLTESSKIALYGSVIGDPLVRKGCKEILSHSSLKFPNNSFICLLQKLKFETVTCLHLKSHHLSVYICFLMFLH